MVLKSIKHLLTISFNVLFFLSCLPETLKFLLKCLNPGKSQLRILKRIINSNRDTDFGRDHRFENIRNYREFSDLVPITEYEFYQEYLEAIGKGGQRVLTSEPVMLLEPTSGSASASKLIPYTRSLKAEFQRAIYPWICELYFHHPGMFFGKMYWSISPVIRETRTQSGMMIGFEDDTGYFSPMKRFFLKNLFAVPDLVRSLPNLTLFKYVTLLFLLREKNLGFVSIWSPTFFAALMKPLMQWKNALIHDIRHGTFSPPGSCHSKLRLGLKRYMKKDPERAAELEKVLDSSEESSCRRLWKQMALISVWKDSSAALSFAELEKKFKGVNFQGKGLLATEGIVSFPFFDGKCVLAVNSHFFEFEEVVSSRGPKRILLCEQLKAGKQYSVILTTGGGLYRYRLRDIILVREHVFNLPVIEFIGKQGCVSDMVGEKLDSIHVKKSVESVIERFSLTPDFVLVSPEKKSGVFFYVLFIRDTRHAGQLTSGIAESLDLEFRKNIHYDYARNIGQLDRVKVFRIEQEDPDEAVLKYFTERNMKMGDVKPGILVSNPGWLERFYGRLL